MKRTVFASLALLFSIAAICQNSPVPAQAPAARVFAIRAGTLIDPRSNTPLHNQVIVVRGNKIESVGSVAPPADAQVIDLSQATVLPGLIDAHTHIFLQGEDPALGGYDVQ